MKLEAKRLQRENKLDELAKLLGDGFAADVNLRKLLGQNREKYEHDLRERLARRRERLAKGLPPEDDDEELDNIESLDGKNLLESLDRRYYYYYRIVLPCMFRVGYVFRYLFLLANMQTRLCFGCFYHF